MLIKALSIISSIILCILVFLMLQFSRQSDNINVMFVYIFLYYLPIVIYIINIIKSLLKDTRDALNLYADSLIILCLSSYYLLGDLIFSTWIDKYYIPIIYYYSFVLIFLMFHCYVHYQEWKINRRVIPQ